MPLHSQNYIKITIGLQKQYAVPAVGVPRKIDRIGHRTETMVRQKAITELTRNHSAAPSAGTKANHFDLSLGGPSSPM